MMPLTFSNTNCHAIAHFLEVGSYRETRGRQFSIVGRKMVSLSHVLLIPFEKEKFTVRFHLKNILATASHFQEIVN